jgi:hypothetical protein
MKIFYIATLLFAVNCDGQWGTDNISQINKNNGTLIIREIFKTKGTEGLAIINIRIYAPPCHLSKGTGIPNNYINIDSEKLFLDSGQTIIHKLTPGIHIISRGEEQVPFNSRKYRFKKNHTYNVDILLPVPFSTDHH